MSLNDISITKILLHKKSVIGLSTTFFLLFPNMIMFYIIGYEFNSEYSKLIMFSQKLVYFNIFAIIHFHKQLSMIIKIRIRLNCRYFKTFNKHF